MHSYHIKMALLFSSFKSLLTQSHLSVQLFFEPPRYTYPHAQALHLAADVATAV